MSRVWNETSPNGGDSLLNAMAINGQYTTGDIAWITFAAAIVWIMIPGIGYAQFQEVVLILAQILLCRSSSTEELLGTRVSKLNVCFNHFLSGLTRGFAILIRQWFFWGYSLTFLYTLQCPWALLQPSSAISPPNSNTSSMSMTGLTCLLSTELEGMLAT